MVVVGLPCSSAGRHASREQRRSPRKPHQVVAHSPEQRTTKKAAMLAVATVAAAIATTIAAAVAGCCHRKRFFQGWAACMSERLAELIRTTDQVQRCRRRNL
jgi:ABC-type phosphate/phosphonate transport system permease subunit